MSTLSVPRIARAIVALGIALTLFGCSQSKGGPGGADSGRTKVVFIPKNTGNPYFNQVSAGFESVAPELGIDFATQAPAVADPTSQLPVVKEQIQQGANVIVLSANSPDALNQVLDQARSKGVVVVTVDSDLTGNEEHRDVGILPTDFSQIGPSQIELLGKLMGYEGEFAILSATTDAPNQNAWIEGMKETLKQPKFAKMKLVETVYGNDEPQKSSTEAESLLTKHPNLRGIVSPTSVGLAAAAQVLENSGMYPGGPKAQGGGIFLTGLSTPKQMRKAVENGVVVSFQLWDPADMGKIAAFLGVQLHQKKLELKEGEEIEVPGFPKLRVGPNKTIFAGPLLTFDKDNISKFEF